MKKTLALSIAVLLLPVIARAQRVDTTKVKPGTYVPELGYFQKAYRDDSDPRFMITDKDGRFSLGVGGTVHMGTFYDFDGAMEGNAFSPGEIAIPMDRTGHFDYTAESSEVYVKARATCGKHKITAVMQLSGEEDNGKDYIMLGKAYVSVDGFTVGKTYSFFMDLEAGPMTVDLQGPNTQISRTHNLVGYTLPIGSKWTVAAALEAPHSISEDYEASKVSADYNQLPDLAAHVKYRGAKGHVQIGALLRQVSYWSSRTGFDVAADGVTKRASGFGVSLSGNYKPSDKLTLSAQAIYGRGISYYIQDLSGLDLSLGMKPAPDADGYAALAPLAAAGGYVSATYRWSDSFRSSAVYGLCHLDPRGLEVADPFKRTSYAAANLFYYFSPYCFLGVEYLYGQKLIYAAAPGADRGHANRLNACLCYKF